MQAREQFFRVFPAEGLITKDRRQTAHVLVIGTMVSRRRAIVMPESRLEALRPEFRTVAVKWLHIVTEDIGLDVRVLETRRDGKRQRELEASGASLVKFGWHNLGLALDFAVFRDGGYLKDDSSGDYLKCGLVAEALDCIWGGRWARLKDYGHIEFHPGFTLQQFLASTTGRRT